MTFLLKLSLFLFISPDLSDIPAVNKDFARSSSRTPIYVERCKMDLPAVVDVTPLNHVNELKILGSIEHLAEL
jgi:hypothetical protein